jgi:hypothetical protein
MEHDDTQGTTDGDERPGLRQRLHAATGDRDAEAQALADQVDGEVDVDDAKVAVQRSHGEAGAGQPRPVTEHPDEELAVPSDVEDVQQEREAGGPTGP